MQVLSCARLSAMTLAMLVSLSLATPAPLCSPQGEEDPREARFCAALNTFVELYAAAAGDHLSSEYQAALRDFPPFAGPAMKRQDVVHSFLRFGRRR